MQHSVRYIVTFAATICVVCSIFVAGSAVLLRERQAENKVLDRQEKVLGVAGLLEEGEKLTPDEVRSRYEQNIKPEVIELSTGAPSPDVDVATFDQQAAKADPAASVEAPENPAKVLRLPKHALVYRLEKDGKTATYIFPIEGKGLWSTLYGYLAVDADLATIRGITFYEHGETPGLGGEVDNPRWKGLWPDRKAFGPDGTPKIEVKKGQAGTPAEDPFHVDGLSGATLTSRGVTHLVQFWLGKNGFGPYIQRQKGTSASAARPRSLELPANHPSVDSYRK